MNAGQFLGSVEEEQRSDEAAECINGQAEQGELQQELQGRLQDAWTQHGDLQQLGHAGEHQGDGDHVEGLPLHAVTVLRVLDFVPGTGLLQDQENANAAVQQDGEKQQGLGYEKVR